jgi:long-chain fatty acid transport protein
VKELRGSVSVKSVALAVISILLLPGTPQAGGLYVEEFGTPEMGTATAGAEARASDAATAMLNPAGMTRLDDHQLMLAIAPGVSDAKFEPDPGSPTPGSDGGQQGGFVPIMSSHYVHKLSDNWRLGFSLASISGAALDPSDDWVGRSEVTRISLFTLSAIPSVAYRVNDWLSLGAGAAMTYGRLDWKLDIPRPLLPDGKVKLDDADDFKVAPMASIMIEPSSACRLGVVYLGKTDFDLNGDVKIDPSGLAASIDANMPLAQAVRTSGYFDLSPKLALLVSAGWEDWSVLDKVPVSIKNGSFDAPLGMKDTWYGAIGFALKASDRVTVQTGVRYDSSPLDSKDRTASLPIDEQIRFGLGTLHDLSDTLTLGMAFEYVDLGKADLNNSAVVGSYNRNSLYLFALNLNWKQLPWSGRLSL